MQLIRWLMLRCLHSPSANTVGNFNRQCLSCDLVENCTYFSASFSHSADFFLLKCEGKWQDCFEFSATDTVGRCTCWPGRLWQEHIPGQGGARPIAG